ncbi:SRPBCC family protein [Nocardioides sp. ChNu-153]|uniref:SRPBCC family protein n=1 Tax=unclassified Nocardioides TaxID=2615069 RepID=UPI002404F81C|nr:MULTISPECIES: SRPBCC family protein [unclassified Nocardioides]MDF9717715.1 SRPBCC family protein [Nocardioides sp. ChNu-99]MDN7121818.1 SRPBCC family protein [Nocardioides sp. ChNu-153]
MAGRLALIADVTVPVAAPVDAVHAYLADPANRPAWQSSLRRVEDVEALGDHPGAAGSSWRDVTAVPGIAPRMRVEASEPPYRWVESGTWRSVRATLAMTYVERTDGGTDARAVAHVEVPGPFKPVALALRLVAPAALRSDLRRAAKVLARGQ